MRLLERVDSGGMVDKNASELARKRWEKRRHQRICSHAVRGELVVSAALLALREAAKG